MAVAGLNFDQNRIRVNNYQRSVGGVCYSGARHALEGFADVEAEAGAAEGLRADPRLPFHSRLIMDDICLRHEGRSCRALSIGDTNRRGSAAEARSKRRPVTGSHQMARPPRPHRQLYVCRDGEPQLSEEFQGQSPAPSCDQIMGNKKTGKSALE
jgi:hypothetical protein